MSGAITSNKWVKERLSTCVCWCAMPNKKKMPQNFFSKKEQSVPDIKIYYCIFYANVCTALIKKMGLAYIMILA